MKLQAVGTQAQRRLPVLEINETLSVCMSASGDVNARVYTKLAAATHVKLSAKLNLIVLVLFTKFTV